MPVLLVARLLGQVPTTTPEPGGEEETGGEAILAEGGIDAADWILAAAILAGSFLLAAAVRRLVVRLVERSDEEHHVAIVVGRFVSAVVIVGGFVYALSVLGVRIGPLLGAIGIGGIALAFALQHVLENSVAAVLLQARRPFVVGDQISSSELRGTVEDINLRAVVIRTEGGNRILLPSSSVLQNPLTNHTAFDRRRTTLTVAVAYDTDLDRAQQVLADAAADAPGVLEFPAVEAYVHEFADSGVNFALRYWHPPRIADEWRVRDEVARTVRRALVEAGITIPFPQRTLWWGEGPEGNGDTKNGPPTVASGPRAFDAPFDTE